MKSKYLLIIILLFFYVNGSKKNEKVTKIDPETYQAFEQDNVTVVKKYVEETTTDIERKIWKFDIPLELTPLMLAARCGSIGIVNYLITRNANVNAVDHTKKSVLSHALLGNHHDRKVIEAIVNAQGFSTLNRADDSQNFPIHYAISTTPEIVHLLITKKSLIDPHNCLETPLLKLLAGCFESSTPQFNTARLLVQHGANPLAKDSTGRTIKDVIRFQQHFKVREDNPLLNALLQELEEYYAINEFCIKMNVLPYNLGRIAQEYISPKVELT